MGGVTQITKECVTVCLTVSYVLLLKCTVFTNV